MLLLSTINTFQKAAVDFLASWFRCSRILVKTKSLLRLSPSVVSMSMKFTLLSTAKEFRKVLVLPVRSRVEASSSSALKKPNGFAETRVEEDPVMINMMPKRETNRTDIMVPEERERGEGFVTAMVIASEQ